MIERQTIDDRRHILRCAAGKRWKELIPSVVDAKEKLSRSSPLETATPIQRQRYMAREFRKASARPHGFGFERKIGDGLEFDAVAPTEDALIAGHPVAMIVDLLGNGRVGDGFATGFLVHGPLLITNWHIFAEPGEADGMGAQFGFQIGDDGLMNAGTVFELDPSRFFYSNRELDIAIVGIGDKPVMGDAETALSAYGLVHLIPAVGKILVGQPVSIIQHPDGMHKQWAVRQNKLLREPTETDLFIEYSTDTLPGSSGAPAFNKDWELVGVHHSGVPRMDGDDVLLLNGDRWRPGDPDSRVDWVANEGARVSKIVAHLKTVELADRDQQAMLSRLIDNSNDDLVGKNETMSDSQRLEHRNVARTGEASGGPTIIVNGNATFHFHNNEMTPPTNSEAIGRDPSPTPSRLEAKIRFDPNYSGRPGYDDRFLEGFTIPVPKAPLDDVIRHGRGQKILRYHHYSLAMHKDRRFCLWAAANVDYDESKRFRTRKQLGEDHWKTDPRILGELQIEGHDLYDPAKKFDKGHIIRRDAIAWGETRQEEEFANSDSFHYTNCTPQHEDFNRAIFGHKGIWGKLEAYIEKQSKYVGRKLNVISGPILADNDPFKDFGVGVDIQVPIGFWKIVIVVEETDSEETLRAYGFTLSQQRAIDEFGWEGRFRVGQFDEQQRSLSEITELTGVEFPDILHEADPLALVTEEGSRRLLTDLNDIDLG